MKKPKRPEKSAAEKSATADQARDGAVRSVNSAFNRNPPRAIFSAGHYTVPKDEIDEADKLPVPDGRYRIIGLDWIHEFKGGKWIATEKARPNVDPKGIVEIA